MTPAEYKARTGKKTRTGKGKSKQSHISSYNVSDTSGDISSNLMFKSATQIAKNAKNGTMVSDYVYVEKMIKINKGEKEGITITLPDGKVVKYLRIK